MNEPNAIQGVLTSLFANPVFAITYALYVSVVKGIALWKSARNERKYWFIFLLVINLFGIPELLYIFYFSKHPVKLPPIKLPASLNFSGKSKKK